MRSGVVACLVAAATLVACGGAQKGSKTVASASAAPAKLTPAEIAVRAMPSIVSVRTPDGFGTGFVVREDGWIVTNLHVVAGAERATVALPDKTVHPVVEVVSVSAPHDLVVLRIEAKKLPVLTLGDSDAVHPGDPIVAIGHPLGLEDTVSNGLLSAVRKVDGLVVLQVSAPIAPGSSGGPLFNEQGEVIGVATAILSGGQNLNLGLPASYVRELVARPDPLPFERFASSMAELRRRLAPQKRDVPKLAVGVFSGCDDDALKLLAHGIAEAISVGAPLYNDGNHRACYQIYEGAASDIEHRLPRACAGPRRTLSQGRARASRLSDPDAQAWAMRDAFDSLISALERRGAER